MPGRRRCPSPTSLPQSENAVTENTTSTANTVSGEKLRSYIERIEHVREDRKALADDEKMIFAEAKSDGFDPKYMRAILKLRAVPPSERHEHEAMLEMYSAALGMATETPLFRHIQGMSRDSMAREAIISALKLLAPEDGEITIRVGQGARVRIWRDKDGVHADEVVERPAPEDGPRPSRPSRADAAKRSEVPDCTLDEARQLGRQARRDDEPVIANPFPWDDKRRRLWDEGWRAEDGGDGMGPA